MTGASNIKDEVQPCVTLLTKACTTIEDHIRNELLNTPNPRVASECAALHHGVGMSKDTLLVSDHDVQKVLEKKEFHRKGEKIYSIHNIKYGKIGDDFETNEQLELVKQLVAKYSDIFSTEALPRASMATPLEVKMRDNNVKLPFCSTQSYKPNERKYLYELSQQWLAFGIIEPTQQPATCCRMTLARKDDDLRECYDGRPLNKLLQGMSTHYTDKVEMVNRASNSYFWKSKVDLHSAYFQIPVSGKSKYLLGIALPNKTHGQSFYNFKRMPFGLSSAGVYMVEYMRKIIRQLPPPLQLIIAVYIDDVVISSPTFKQHLKDLEAFFIVCRKNKISLKPTKCKFLTGYGFDFLGFLCKRGHSTLTNTSVKALEDLEPPANKDGIRHVLGILSVSRRYVRNFAQLAIPLTQLLKKTSHFAWEEPQKVAFETLKQQLIKSTRLYKFDPKYPVIIHTDASLVACGCWVAQSIPGRGLCSMAFYSTTLNPQQRNWSAFAREAYALLWSLKKAAIYVDSSPYETIVFSDAHSLQYINASTRTALSSRLLGKVAHMRIRVLHIPGKHNIVADGLSRAPMKGIRQLNGAYLSENIRHMLYSLPAQLKDVNKVWIYIAQEKQAYKIVQEWRGKKNAMVTDRPDPNKDFPPVNLAIIQANVLQQPKVAKQLLQTNTPCCILICTDLISRIYLDEDNSIDRNLYEIVKKAKKRISITTNTTWILHNVPEASNDITLIGVGENETLSLQSITGPIGDGPELEYGETRTMAEQLADKLDTSDWPRLLSETQLPESYANRKWEDPNGYVYIKHRGVYRRLVPMKYRQRIIAYMHQCTNHSSVKYTNAALSTDFIWPDQKKDIQQYINNCEECKLSKTRIAKLHGMYKSSTINVPRAHYAMDVKRCSYGKLTRYILAMVCKFSGYVTVCVTEKRNSTSIINAIRHNINYRSGPATTIHPDAGLEFTSKKLKTWCDQQGTKLRQPTANYPQQHGAVERFWIDLKEAFRRLKDFSKWEMELHKIVYNHNCRINETTGYSPHQLFYGGPPNSVLANHIRQQSEPPSSQPTKPREDIMLATGSLIKQAAANGNATRRNRVAKLNKKSRQRPKKRLNEGQIVYVYRPVSGNAPDVAQGRPKTFARTNYKGKIVKCNHPFYTVQVKHKKVQYHINHLKT